MRNFATVAAFAVMTIGTSASAAAPKTLLQDLKSQGVTDAEAAVITNSTCLALTKTGRYDVLCGDDLRSLLRYGALASRFESCRADGCFGKMAEALKARFVVSGAVSRLGEVYVLSLTMFDTKKTRAVGRAEVKAPTLEKLQLQIQEAVSSLRPVKRGR